VRGALLLITQQDLARVIHAVGIDALMDETILALESTFADPAGLEVRTRDGFTLHNRRDGVLEWMPAMRPDHTATLKVVAYNPDNPTARGLPTIMASNCVYDCRTGGLVAVVDGVFATALRTGAASAVATRHLARPGSSVLGLVGCGAQAVTQLHALSRVLRLERVLVHDTDPVALDSFARRVAFTGLRIEPTDRDALEEQADVVCTATSVEPGKGPVIRGDPRRMRPGVHVNAVGSDLPGKTELPRDLLDAAVVVPDFLPQALVEGECQQLDREAIGPSLPEVVAGGSGPSLWDRITVFDSTGFALEDHVVTEIILEHARRIGAGSPLPLFTGTDDALNPYWLAGIASGGGARPDRVTTSAHG
jgi:L-lysine cyclodeaminase